MKKMSKGMLMTALICGAVYLGGSPVYANELQEFALDEYVVTAARTETKLVDTASLKEAGLLPEGFGELLDVGIVGSAHRI